jgi:hypothetical protein
MLVSKHLYTFLKRVVPLNYFVKAQATVVRCRLLWFRCQCYQWNSALLNEGKSAASFCLQVAALVPAMFCNFYLVKNHEIADNSAATEGREKISSDLESVKFYNFL